MQSLQFNTMTNSTDDMHIYYDINMFNNDQNLQGNPTNSLVFNDSRNIPYLQQPSKYYVSIVRFTLMTAQPSIPVFIPHVELGQANPNKTIYSFTIKNGAAYTTTTITYIPSNSTLTANPPLTTQDLSNEYYYVFQYQLWVNMMNTALNTCATTAGLAVPYIEYDVQTSLLKLYVPQSWGANTKLMCNQRLYVLLDSIPAVFSFENNANLYSLYNGNAPLPKFYKPITINAVAYYEIDQETTSIGLLNPVSSVIFTTSLLPVANALTSPPQIFNANTGLNSNGNNSNITPIITDFQVPMTNASTYKNTLTYVPTAEYRLIDLRTDTPLSSVQLSVFWKDVYGNLHPFRLASGCSCNLKLLFRKKDFNLPIEQ